MSGIDDLNFEDLVDGAINTIEDGPVDDDRTERFEAKKLLQPKLRTSGSKPPILGGKQLGGDKGAQVSTDETIEMDDTARMSNPPGSHPPEIPTRAQSGNATFDHIYMRAGVQPQEFTVFRIEELFNDEDLADLDEKARLAAVRAVLKSHDIDFETIVDDAVARRAALDAHDQRLKSNIQRVEREMEKENAKLQAEIEEYANPRIDRMEKNNERVERLRGDYQDWFSRNQAEQNRIVTILQPWGGDDRVRATEQVDAVHSATTVPTESVSGDEAFEPEPSDARMDEVEAPRPVDDSVLADAGADQWDFDSEPSEVSEAKVDTDLPSEYEPAAPVGATGEFDFQGSPMRIPRTAVHWLFTLFVLLIALPVMILLAAQLDGTEAPGAMGALFIGFFAPILFAVIPTVLTRKSDNFWTGGVTWWFVGVLLAFGVAHYDPANLTENLTKRPLWFIDEVGLNSSVEEAVFGFTGQYAHATAPLLGTEGAIWKPEAKKPDSKAADE